MIPHIFIICKLCGKKEYVAWHPIWLVKDICWECRDKMYKRHKGWMDRILERNQLKECGLWPNYCFRTKERVVMKPEHRIIYIFNDQDKTHNTITNLLYCLRKDGFYIYTLDEKHLAAGHIVVPPDDTNHERRQRA